MVRLKGNKKEAQVELFLSLYHTTILCNILKFLFLPKEKKKIQVYWSGIHFFAREFANNRWVVLQHLPHWNVEVLFPRPQQ